MDNVDPLPNEWERIHTDDGRLYYYHQKSNTTQWDTPPVTDSDNDSDNDSENEEEKQIEMIETIEQKTDTLPPGWEEINNNGQIYYYNAEQDITQWDRPTVSDTNMTLEEVLIVDEHKSDEVMEEILITPLNSPVTPFQGINDTPITISGAEQQANTPLPADGACTKMEKDSPTSRGFHQYVKSDTNIKNVSDNKSTVVVAKESCLLQLESTPFKSRIVQMNGYNIFVECCTLNLQNRKWLPSVLLAVILLLIPFISPAIDAINVSSGNGCIDPSAQMNKYLEDYKNGTNYYAVKDIGEQSKNITLDLYDEAVNRYNSKYSKLKDIKSIDKEYLFETVFEKDENLTAHCYTASTSCYSPELNQSYTCFNDTPSNCMYWIRGRYIENGIKFPTPYQQSESDLRGNSDRVCEQKVCFEHELLGVLCKTFSYQCNLQLDVNSLFVEGDEFSKITAEELSVGGKDLLYDIYDKAKFFGSLYCYYMTLMIFVGGPYIMTSTRLRSKIQKKLNSVTAIWFIAVLLILYYLIEILIHVWNLFVINSNLFIILKLSMVDACFADTAFVFDLFEEVATVCSDIGYSERLHDASIDNLMYYEAVEQTYKYYYFADKEYIENNPADQPLFEYNHETDRLFYDSEFILSEQYNLQFPQSITLCQVGTMLDYIEPSDSILNFESILLFSSIIAALLLQPILANLIRSLFIWYDPLSLYCGRVEMPYQYTNDQSDNDVHRIHSTDNSMDGFQRDILNQINEDNIAEKTQQKIDAENVAFEKIVVHIKKWERKKNYCPCFCWFVSLGLILGNLIVVWT